MLSKTTEYAIRFLLYLANLPEVKKASISEISEAANTPLRFSGKLLRDLGQKSFVSSQKGPKGGFYMTEDQKKVSLRKLIKVYDGNSFDNCILGLEGCSEEEPCPLHDSYKEIKMRFVDLFEKTTISSLSADPNKLTFIRRK